MPKIIAEQKASDRPLIARNMMQRVLKDIPLPHIDLNSYVTNLIGGHGIIDCLLAKRLFIKIRYGQYVHRTRLGSSHFYVK